MIKAPPYARLHYRSAFSLAVRPDEGADEKGLLWTMTVKTVRRWLAGGLTRNGYEVNDAFGSAWFYRGGEWAPPAGRGTRVQTVARTGSGTEAAPQQWAVRFVHPCGEVAHRWWQTDICLSRAEDDTLSVAFLNYHWLAGHYVGVEPDAPPATTPSLVRLLLSMDAVEASHGNVIIRATPRVVAEQELDDFRPKLLAEARDCPVVWLALRRESEKPSIDPAVLSRALAGNAVVCVPQTLDASEYFAKTMPYRLSADDGMVRVYMPSIAASGTEDYRRHRFFLAEAVDDLGPDKVVELLAAALARRYSRRAATPAATVDDIAAANTRDQLHARIASIPESEKPDWIGELETEIERADSLSRALEEENARLRAEAEQQDATYQESLEHLQADIKAERYRRQEAERRANAGGASSQMAPLADAVAVHGIPVESLADALSLVCKVFPDRVRVCDEAMTSAARAGFNSARDQMPYALRMLWHLATTMYDLMFVAPPKHGTIEQAFRDRTGIDLAMTERKMTKSDSNLMKLRERTIDGVTLNCIPHLKSGSDPKTALRIHFDRLESDSGKRVFIGHCGDHLDTAGTRKAR